MTTENMPPSFVHLHLNTNRFPYHSMVAPKEAARVCAETGMPACACTDHGTLSASMNFRNEMECRGVKPIYGCEFIVSEGGESLERPMSMRQPHDGMTLVCLAETLEGYRNLCRLASGITLRNDGRVSAIDKNHLRQYSRGLIALSGGPRGEVSRKCKEGAQAVDEAIAEYLDIFGRGNFFLELQDHGLPEERAIHRELLAASARMGVPVVATNDVHYLTREQAHAHEVLLCIGGHTTMADPARPALPGGPEYSLKSPGEMARLFQWCPDALQNTVAIADRCHVVIPTTQAAGTLPHQPLFPLPEGFAGTRDDYLRKVCTEGLKRRYGIDAGAPVHTEWEHRVLQRLVMELDFIARHSLANEFLVIWELLWDAGEGVWRHHNTGCRAACGSLVAYLMPITDVDPLQYGLLFERWLNDERIPALFFGIGDVPCGGVQGDSPLLAATRLHGADCVARQIDMGRLEADGIVEEIANVLLSNSLGVSIKELVRGCRRVALAHGDDLQRLVKEDAMAREIVETAIALEDVMLQEDTMYTGIILSDAPLSDFCAVNAEDGAGASNRICHLEWLEAGDLGLMRIDCFPAEKIVVDALRGCGKAAWSSPCPENDPRAFELLSRPSFFCGDDVDEYGELGRLLPMVQPRCMDELIACYAMARPGPIQLLSEYLRRRAGEVPIVYEMPELEPLLKETYGLILYQEQLMQIIHVVSDLSLGKADRIRRSLQKKKQETKMWHDAFRAGARKRGLGDDAIDKIWETLQCHARYCFLKAHAAARAFVLYRVACIRAGVLKG